MAPLSWNHFRFHRIRLSSSFHQKNIVLAFSVSVQPGIRTPILLTKGQHATSTPILSDEERNTIRLYELSLNSICLSLLLQTYISHSFLLLRLQLPHLCRL